ncbi:toxic anion resistance protein [Mucilaginibacter gossypii]|uniref:toxic anion resistance protein n=1 Tax=Mucilaginibacter gossypii TaxID=551996 RepID=UPI000DCECE43|nr:MULTISPECIES: toxic anion resistance protein [Mucilaginibacter]QTE36165.1 toxic anion resistance protein [Mucilaginibacter gossypii]RAV60246.1 toxic anion resistance protein [Mucilaginibacter rubeus]
MESAPNNDELNLNIPPLITPTNLDLPAAAAPTGNVPMKVDKQGNVNLDAIPNQDLQKYGEMGKDINPADVNSILNYGVEVQNSMEKYSNNFLTSVRTYNSGEVGGLINELLTELNYIDVDELNQNAFTSFISHIPFMKKLVVDTKKLFQKYDTVVNNIDKITNKIKAGRVNSLKDNSSLQTMFDSNVTYIKQMEDLIIAGQLKYNELNEKLAVMDGNPTAYQDYEIADLRDFVNRLDKRLADLKVVRFIMMQSLAQIRVVQNNNTTIAEKAQSIVSTTIPVWKNQLTIAVALNRQKENVEMQKKISDTTNTILQKNAEMLKQNSIDVARENEKTVVSLDTLKKTTSSLIETLTEVKRIHDEGTANRRTLNTELQNLETELKKTVTSVS